MNFEDYQEAVKRTMPDTGRRDRLAMLALGTAGEAGEVADTVKKHLFQGHNLDTVEVAKEIGDVLWYLGNLCTAIGWDMGAVAEYNVEKLQIRYPNGFETGRSRVRLVEDETGLVGAREYGVIHFGEPFIDPTLDEMIVEYGAQNATAQDVVDRHTAEDWVEWCTQ